MFKYCSCSIVAWVFNVLTWITLSCRGVLLGLDGYVRTSLQEVVSCPDVQRLMLCFWLIVLDRELRAMVTIGNIFSHYSQTGCCCLGRREVLQQTDAIHSSAGHTCNLIPFDCVEYLYFPRFVGPSCKHSELR